MMNPGEMRQMQLSVQEKQRELLEKSEESLETSDATAPGPQSSKSKKTVRSISSTAGRDSKSKNISENSRRSQESSQEKAPGSQAPKTPFIRKPHLTNRPFQNNEQLEAIKMTLPQNKKQNHKGGRPPKHPRKPRTNK